MASEAPSEDPIVRRRQLAAQYKPLEFDAISSLFRSYANFRTWSKVEVLQRVMLDHGRLGDNVKNTAADKISRAADLRREAMTLWPAGTAAAQKHWDWIDVLDKIRDVLRTKVQDNTIESRQKIVSEAPQTAVDDSSSWVDVDLDIGIKQMAHWRRTLLDIWDEAIDDPTKMSGADIATGAAIRYFRQEMAAMYVCYDWFQKSGSFKSETLDYMKKSDPDGIGGEIVKTVDVLRKKKVIDIEKSIAHQVVEAYNFPRNFDVWLFADAAKHNNPLYEWLTDMAAETRKNKKTNQTHSEFVLAYLFLTDAMNQVEDRLQLLRSAAVRRLTDMTVLSRHVNEYFAHFGSESTTEEAKLITSHFVQRVQAMNRYTTRQLSVPAIAVVHSWADYGNIMLNVFGFIDRRLTMLAYMFDATVILGLPRIVRRPAAVDGFCNLYRHYLYPEKGRPRTEAEWKEVVKGWSGVMELEDAGGLNNKLSDSAEVDRTGKNWARIALTEDNLSATAKDFRVSKGVVLTRGTEKWWDEIKQKAATILQEPSVIAGVKHLTIGGWQDATYNIVTELQDLDWEANRTKVEETIEKFFIPQEWLDTLP